jgi:hypothetical protein
MRRKLSRAAKKKPHPKTKLGLPDLDQAKYSWLGLGCGRRELAELTLDHLLSPDFDCLHTLRRLAMLPLIGNLQNTTLDHFFASNERW